MGVGIPGARRVVAERIVCPDALGSARDGASGRYTESRRIVGRQASLPSDEENLAPSVPLVQSPMFCLTFVVTYDNIPTEAYPYEMTRKTRPVSWTKTALRDHSEPYKSQSLLRQRYPSDSHLCNLEI